MKNLEKWNNKISKFVDIKKLVHLIYILLWVVLVICLIFKYAFNWWFPIVVRNTTFINICNFIDNHKWCYYFISLVSMMFTDNLWFLIAIKRNKTNPRKMLIFVAIGIFLSHLIKFWINEIIGNIIEILFIVLLPIVYNLTTKTFKNTILNIFFPIIIYVIINIWQLNILLIRDIQETLKNTPSIISLMLQVDYYIFILITFMEVNNMGIFGGWFFGKSETELLALKEEELKKEHPDEKKLKAIEERIEKLKKEAK